MLKIIQTADGSQTVFNEVINENYHSSFGAVQESRHIFINAALNQTNKEEVSVLEIGFGTGLNALLTLEWADRNRKKVNFTGVEAYPLSWEMISKLHYTDVLGLDLKSFQKLHSPVSGRENISYYFTSEIIYATIQQSEFPENEFDVVYFDAFSPEVQPEMWQESIFQKIAFSMKSGALLTTYSCKGAVKRTMVAAGLLVEKLPGPPGKREFLRAKKM